MSFYRGLFAVVVMLGVTIISTGAFAAVPLTLTHQGRLLDATDQPVNGVLDITYRIFEVPSGGSPLWTEVHPSVPVADGLFSALLGSTVPLSADVLGNGGGGGGGGALSPRYLEVSVGGTTLLPRLALSSVPSAISAGHVSGDVETAPGQFTVTNNGSVNSGRLRVLTTSDSAVLVMDHDSNGDGVPETSISSSCDPSGMSQVMEKKGLNAVNVKLARTISSPPGGPLAQDYLDVDSDDDGVMDRSVSSSCDGTGARSILKGGMSGSTTGTIRMMATPDSAVTLLGHDLEGDGIYSPATKQYVDNDDASMQVSTSGTTVHHNVASIGAVLNGNVVIGCLADVDGDGVAEQSVENKSGPGGSSSTIKSGMSGSTTGTIRMQSTGGGPVMPSGEILLEADLDGDGVPDVTSADSVDASGASRRLKSSGIGSSGNDGVEVQLSARPSGAYIGIGHSQNAQTLRCSGSADADSATMLLEADVDGNGITDNSLASTCDASSVKIIMDRDSGRSKARMAAGDAGSNLSLSSSSSDESVDVAVDNGTGPGAHPSSSFRLGRPAINTALIVSDESGVNLKTQSSGRNIGLHVSDVTGQCKLAMVDATLGTEDTTIVIDGNLKRFGIGVSQPDSPIQHSSGARLTAAGDWTNASDRNLKENFSKVDGEELLEKIEELPISRWNYRIDSDNVTHIGPTAQDFKAAFGVGANDKTISTIDPSGIALAAIKALNSKIQELDAKTNEITQLKAELDAIKAMLQKQAVTKN